MPDILLGAGGGSGEDGEPLIGAVSELTMTCCLMAIYVLFETY